MADDLCKLTLVYPRESDDALVSVLEGFEAPGSGFTTWNADGHGHGFEGASHAEKVAGRVARRVATMILSRKDADDLLERIGRDSPVPHLMYWMEPVLMAGRLV